MYDQRGSLRRTYHFAVLSRRNETRRMRRPTVNEPDFRTRLQAVPLFSNNVLLLGKSSAVRQHALIALIKTVCAQMIPSGS